MQPRIILCFVNVDYFFSISMKKFRLDIKTDSKVLLSIQNIPL